MVNTIFACTACLIYSRDLCSTIPKYRCSTVSSRSKIYSPGYFVTLEYAFHLPKIFLSIFLTLRARPYFAFTYLRFCLIFARLFKRASIFRGIIVAHLIFYYTKTKGETNHKIQVKNSSFYALNSINSTNLILDPHDQYLLSPLIKLFNLIWEQKPKLASRFKFSRLISKKGVSCIKEIYMSFCVQTKRAHLNSI